MRSLNLGAAHGALAMPTVGDISMATSTRSSIWVAGQGTFGLLGAGAHSREHGQVLVASSFRRRLSHLGELACHALVCPIEAVLVVHSHGRGRVAEASSMPLA